MRIGLDLNEKPAFTVADSAFDSAVQGRGEILRMKACECQELIFSNINTPMTMHINIIIVLFSYTSETISL